MKIRNETIKRAFDMAQKDGAKITEDNAEGYFMAALSKEIEMITNGINTVNGQKVIKAVSDNMATRMHSKINPLKS